MNNGQVTWYAKFYHALEVARGKSAEELTREITGYERRVEQVRQMPFLRRLFARVGDPEVHIVNQSVRFDKQLEARAQEWE